MRQAATSVSPGTRRPFPRTSRGGIGLSRPVGVTLVALLLIAVSAHIAHRVIGAHGGRTRHALVLATWILVALALVAAEALWSLRAHAFPAFVAWGLAAMVAVALERLASPAGAHPVRMIPDLVYGGLAFAAAAIYLRRAV